MKSITQLKKDIKNIVNNDKGEYINFLKNHEVVGSLIGLKGKSQEEVLKKFEFYNDKKGGYIQLWYECKNACLYFKFDNWYVDTNIGGN